MKNVKMLGFKDVLSHRMEVINYEGCNIALDGWNGEIYTKCFELDKYFCPISNGRDFEARPIYEEDVDYDQFIIVNYEVNEI